MLELGDQIGVVPQVEVWGGSKTLGRLGEAARVAIEAHTRRRASSPTSIICIEVAPTLAASSCSGPSSIHVFHFNDYPADPPREQATDADRVYPGDGVAPLGALLRDLSTGGFHVTLSLELFNRKYWAQDPQAVVRTGLEKMQALIQGV